MMNALLSSTHSIIWHNPNVRLYVEGSGLLKLDGNRWLAVVPVVPRLRGLPQYERRAKESRIHLVLSEDAGRNWRPISELAYYSAVPFQHQGAVYLFAMKGGIIPRNDDLLLLRSEDAGATWSKPVTLFKGHYWNCHTGMVVRDGRLYWAVDDLSFGDRFRGPRVVVGDLNRDLMSPEAWRMSNPVPFPGLPDMIKDPDARGRFGKWLEPNVIDVNGALRVHCAVRKTALCGVLDLDDDGQNATLRFAQYHPMPGGQLKFCILHDALSGLYWATANPVVNPQERLDWSRLRPNRDAAMGGDRRLLMLYYSVDSLNWFQAGCVARAPTLGQSFNYATLVVDGDDLGIIARSNINGPSPHDADCATFHRIRRFRDLAMNLLPEMPQG